MLIGLVLVVTGLREAAMLAGREQRARKMMVIETMIEIAPSPLGLYITTLPFVQRNEAGVSILVFDQSAIHCAL